MEDLKTAAQEDLVVMLANARAGQAAAAQKIRQLEEQLAAARTEADEHKADYEAAFAELMSRPD